MILIADSGSTKTAWAVIPSEARLTLHAPRIAPRAHTLSCSCGESLRVITTGGLNPYFLSSQEITQEISTRLLPRLPGEPIQAVYFYGAGVTPAKQEQMQGCLQEAFGGAQTQVASDLLGSARALFGREGSGIACILGTGSNSALYERGELLQNIPALGFILGDEGSGAVLGKLFLGSMFKGTLPPEVYEAFSARFGLSVSDVIERVYRSPLPNRFLASFAPFIRELTHEYPSVRELVEGAFTAFLTRNVLLYPAARTLPVGFVGSIAYHFADELRAACRRAELRLPADSVVASPLGGLVRYHLQDEHAL